MSSISTGGEWVRTIAAAISPVLVVVGWWLINRQNNGREKRKEVRQLIDRALETVADVIDLGTKYHGGADTASAPPHLDSWRLTLRLTQVAGYLKLLSERGLPVESSYGPYIHLKYALTGGDFQTAVWTPWTPDDRRWMDVLHATNALEHALDGAFIRTFSD